VETFAQKTFSKTYPAAKDIRLELTNREGTVTVIGWNRDQVEIKANLEAPAANIIPQNLSGKILINVVKDNLDRRQVGSCNFTIKVPYSSSVDIETRMGNLKISDVRGMRVRAHISTEGDITLTNIFSQGVWAENTMGDIFFDGEIQQGGTYLFKSMRGNIGLRIPFNSSFRLVATAPSTREITLGGLNNAGLSFVHSGRRVVGQINGGSASLTVTNHRGRISFYSR
jgi:DUF4097 and DUF4098 domain-containing protein YvlB